GDLSSLTVASASTTSRSRAPSQQLSFLLPQPLAQLAHRQERARLHRPRRDAAPLGDLALRHAEEERLLHDLPLLGGQPLQRGSQSRSALLVPYGPRTLG